MRFSLLVPAVLLALGDGALAIYGCICKDATYGAEQDWTAAVCNGLGGSMRDNVNFHGQARFQCKFDGRASTDPATWDTVCQRGNAGQWNTKNRGGQIGKWSGYCNTAV
ncbi:hypothetical protein Ptr902_11828 [Pyrenophora tritici-repentis]|nr:hypothetical protein Ptr902_11828 [Pyrenophora tritici-repentis]